MAKKKIDKTPIIKGMKKKVGVDTYEVGDCFGIFGVTKFNLIKNGVNTGMRTVDELKDFFYFNDAKQ